MLRRAILGMVGTMGVISALLAASGQRAGASQLLLNPGFEQWANGRPSGWVTSPGVTTTQSSESVSGTAVELNWGSGNARISQTVEGVGGASYAAAASVAANIESSSTIRITFIDAGFTPLANSIQTRILSVGWEALAVQATAPTGTAFVTVAVEFSPVGPGFGRVDEASLEETLPPPTPTPTPDATATPTETAEPTATATATSEASPTATSTSAPGATATATSSSGGATATATRTPTRTATATRTPTPERQATATRTPTMGPTPTSTKGPALSSFGGMLYNGDFEDVDGERPPGWTKFGGTMLSSMDAYRGNRAVKLESDTSSTKWIYQVATITEGGWYRAAAFAKVEGGGGAFIRLSWYESADGGGTAIGNDDSAETQGGSWRQLDTGSVEAPTSAKSVRVRLMLRPSGLATASFDDALLEASAAATPTATATPRPTSATPASNAPSPANPEGDVRPDAGPAAPGTGTGSGLVDTVAGAAVVAQGGGTMRLSEVLADPAETGRDAPFEWVELFNPGSEAVSLEGWGIGDGREVDKLPAVAVPAGGYAVVAGRSAVLPANVLVVRVADGEIGAGLNNDGETIRLVAPDGTEVDAISFGSDTTIFDPAPPAPPAGRTLGARNPAADPDPANWAVTLQATPGEPNTFAASRTPSATAKPGGSATTGASGSNEDQPPVSVDRGERDSPIPWIVMAGAAGVGGAGAVLGWQRLGKKQRRGS